MFTTYPNHGKSLEAVMNGFAVATIKFVKTDGPLSERAIEEAWIEVWAEWLIGDTKS